VKYKKNLIVSFWYEETYDIKKTDEQEEVLEVINGENKKIEIKVYSYNERTSGKKKRIMKFEGFKIAKPKLETPIEIEFLIEHGEELLKYSLNSNEKPEKYFLANMYFDVGIIDELRLKKSMTVTPEGYVFRGHYWGTFRGFRNLGLSMIVCNLGDFWEGIPSELWNSWKDYNEQPPSFEEKKETFRSRHIWGKDETN